MPPLIFPHMVMVHLLHFALAAYHYPVITKMVLEITMIHSSIVGERDVSTVKQYLLECIILIYHIATINYSMVTGRERCLVAG